jgi:hypothetical protein
MSREIAAMERNAHSKKVDRHKNPPIRPLDTSVDWLVFDGGFLPTKNGALQHNGDLGVLFCAPSVRGDEPASTWVRSMTPNVSIFMDGKALYAALEDGWIGAAMRAHQPLAEVQKRIAKGRFLFHYHFDLHPSEVSAEAIKNFDVIWPEYLKNHSWQAFRQALHSGQLPGAPKWWQQAPLA